MFEAYAVGVRLTLINQVSGGLVSLASQFRAFDKNVNTTQNSVNALQNSLLNLKRMGMVGGALVGVGGLGLSLFKAPLEEAAAYQKEVAKLATMGVGNSALKDAMKFADGMNIMGQSARDNLKLIREAYAVTGDMHHAEMLAPQLARMKFGIDTLMGEGHGAGAHTMMMDLLKTAELRGAANDPATFARMTNMAMKAYVASGGTVAPRDFLQAMKTGGVAAKGLSDEAFFFQGLHTMQEFGGNRYGTAMMSAYQNLAQGRGSLRAAKELVGMGLIDPKMIEYTTTGTIKQIKPGALKDSFTMAQNQFEYYEKNVAPQLAGLSKQEAFLKIGSMFSNRTAANLFSTFYNDAPSIKRVFGMARQADGIDGVYSKAGETMAGKMADLSARWRDVMKDLGLVVLPIAIRATESLTNGLKSVISFAREFPLVTKGLVGLFGVLSTAAAAGGAILLAKTAIGGLSLVLGGAGKAGLVAAIAPLIGSGGSLALVAAGVVGLGAALAGLSWLAKSFTASKNDGEPHPGEHWVNGALRGGAGGSWESNRRSLGRGRGYEVWNGSGWFKESDAAGGGRGFVNPAKAQVNVTVINKLDGKGLTTTVVQEMSRRASRPQSGSSLFDPNMGLPPKTLLSSQ
jgi:hypothetical protein